MQKWFFFLNFCNSSTLFISGQSRNSIQSGKNHQNNKSGPHPARKFDWMLNFKFVGEKTRLAPEILVKIEKCHHFDQISKVKYVSCDVIMSVEQVHIPVRSWVRRFDGKTVRSIANWSFGSVEILRSLSFVS